LKREERKTDIVRQEQAQKLERKEAEFKKEVEKSEGELVAMRNDKLRADIKHKTSQLASATMHLVQKSEMLAKLKTDLNHLSDNAPSGVKQQIKQVTRTIESDIQLDNNWDQFEIYFDQVHENFFKRLRQKYPELTPKDQKLCDYLRMNLSTKEIAPLLNISVRGVEISRYRVRRKLDIDSEMNLVVFVMDI
jgi:DNA-binding CsgD family transcriptional regulator